ncbi:peptide chain release factor H [Methylopila capsulata]|uniref:Peptide chain release factor H n=1 Tax=Methylopila capsulata TaxID=61654 RepID=A0A9W6MQK8_9HYPH|nr:peptide chain release factor H [Methylopila capsulata]GLK54086.1 peptide chain release factor H [Methylopila capsulata]
MGESDVTLIVTSGRGPKECRIVVARAVRRLAQEAESVGLSVAHDLRDPATEAASALVSLGGGGAETFAAGWTGMIQWIDGSLRGGGSRRNWFVAVHRIVTPGEAATLRDDEVRFEAMRAGGPGGQHQNVTESAVRAVHLPTGLSAVARDGRSQHQNRKRALERLGALLAGVAAKEALEAKHAAWLDRISVERGNPKRTVREM